MNKACMHSNIQLQRSYGRSELNQIPRINTFNQIKDGTIMLLFDFQPKQEQNQPISLKWNHDISFCLVPQLYKPTLLSFKR